MTLGVLKLNWDILSQSFSANLVVELGNYLGYNNRELMTDDLQQKMAAIAYAVRKGRYRYTIHGAQQRIARGIRRHEIEETIYNGEIIEDYPEHHYGPACLVFGRTSEGRVLHILCAIQPIVGIITVYDPDQKEWKSDLKTRRRIS